LIDDDGKPKYRDYADYIVNHERAPGVGLLAGWRGHGDEHGKGAPNPDQLKQYIAHGGFWHADIPASARYYKMANRDYLQWSAGMGFIGKAEPVVLQLYSETLQKFRLAAQGHGAVQPPDSERERVATYFDPLPIWYEPFEGAQLASERAPPSAPSGHLLPMGEGKNRFPLSAITQRPPFMYHAWGSQNAWLRQITARNYLYLHPDTAARHGIGDDDWVHVDSHNGRITVQAKLASNMQPDTVWTWNAIGKRRGAWKLSANAPESSKGFLLNHLISDITPRGDYANADPVTGQAAWFDLRVRIAKAEAQITSEPQFDSLTKAADSGAAPLRYGANFRKAK
jgi:anaerobic selenocysteine-containing dehydrogenase